MGLVQCTRCHGFRDEGAILLEPDALGIEGGVEVLMQRLFWLHDLNRNGVLEEVELVQLNKKIAMLHHGSKVDTEAVALRYQELFRSKLDRDGKPVPYGTFRGYMMEVLGALDRNEAAQTMILEQFIAEALLGREAFQVPSLQSSSDAPFLAGLCSDAAPLPAAALDELPEVPKLGGQWPLGPSRLAPADPARPADPAELAGWQGAQECGESVASPASTAADDEASSLASPRTASPLAGPRGQHSPHGRREASPEASPELQPPGEGGGGPEARQVALAGADGSPVARFFFMFGLGV